LLAALNPKLLGVDLLLIENARPLPATCTAGGGHSPRREDFPGPTLPS
jgi:hypothetical protein